MGVKMSFLEAMKKKASDSVLSGLEEIALSQVASTQTTIEVLFEVWKGWLREKPFQTVGVAMVAAATGHKPAVRFVQEHQRDIEQIVRNPALAAQAATADHNRNLPCNHGFFLINLLAISTFEVVAKESDEKAAWHKLRLTETETLLEKGVFVEARRLAEQLLNETARGLSNGHPAIEVLRAVVAAKTIE